MFYSNIIWTNTMWTEKKCDNLSHFFFLHLILFKKICRCICMSFARCIIMKNKMAKAYKLYFFQGAENIFIFFYRCILSRSNTKMLWILKFEYIGEKAFNPQANFPKWKKIDSTVLLYASRNDGLEKIWFVNLDLREFVDRNLTFIED